MKKKLHIALIIVVCLVGAIVGIIFLTIQNKPISAEELLDLGEKYLVEMDYEQAIVCFEKVIEIEPMNPRGYTGDAEAYIGLGKLEDAILILQQGYEITGDSSIEEMLVELQCKAWGHKWIEATCTKAKNCSVCGETEGNALEHILVEANYQQSAVCEVCGEKVGEPLQADFEKYGFTCNAQLDVPYTITTTCYSDPDRTTTGTVTFSEYEVFTSDDTHEALDGYEWRAVTSIYTFGDENAWEYGFILEVSDTDYYEIVRVEDSHNTETDTYTVNYMGVDYSEVTMEDIRLPGNVWDGDVGILKFRHYRRVPVGYDGMILYVYSDANSNNGNYFTDKVDDNTTIYRLN